MNITPNTLTFNTDGLNVDFASFDDFAHSENKTPAIVSRKSQDVTFRSDFPGSKKITTANVVRKDKLAHLSWDDIYERNIVNKNYNNPKNLSNSFVDDTFNPLSDEGDRICRPKLVKQRISLSSDFTKARSKEKSRSPKQESIGRNMNHPEYIQAEPVVVKWCRTHSPAFANSSQSSEVTSTTSATSRSGDGYEIPPKAKKSSSNRCVSRSRTVSVMPSQTKHTCRPVEHKIPSTENIFPSDFAVNWPENTSTNQETLNLKQIRDTPAVSKNRYHTPQRAASTSRSVRRDSVIDAHQVTEPTIGKSNRRCSVDNRPHSSFSTIKPRLYMAVSLQSPRKKEFMKSNKNFSNDTKYSEYENKKGGIESLEFDASLSNIFNSNRKNKSAEANSEPLDFSEFDMEDFSSNDDLKDGFSMPFKPVEPLYYTSSKQKKIVQPNNVASDVWPHDGLSFSLYEPQLLL